MSEDQDYQPFRFGLNKECLNLEIALNNTEFILLLVHIINFSSFDSF